MSKRKDSWSSTEETIVKNEIIKNPGNLKESFGIASSKLKNRSEEAVKMRYYNVIRHKKAIVFLSTAALTLENTKNIPRN